MINNLITDLYSGTESAVNYAGGVSDLFPVNSCKSPFFITFQTLHEMCIK